MLKVEGLNKNFPSFSLKNVSFELPKGYILGFIGKNGAGKTTTLKCILNFIKKDSGKIIIFDKDNIQDEIDIKQDIGFMLGEADYYLKSKVKKVASVYKRFFKTWDEEKYLNCLKQFNIDQNKQIGELSTGMRIKLAIAFAISHEAKLFIFDEPTSGLDPIARNDILQLFSEIVKDGEKSIIFSTHITSDLDKCADYILYIKNGEIIANTSKEELIDSHILIAGKKDDLTDGLKSRLIGYKINAFGFIGLMKKDDLIKDDDFQMEIPNLEDIMIYYDTEDLK